MTTYILAGGADRKYAQYGEKLAQEVQKTVQGSLMVLSCFFAEPRELWEEKMPVRSQWLKQVFGDDTNVALAMPDTFIEQVQKSDIIYLHGGDDVLLAHYLDAVQNLTEVWADKIVIGSSAGAAYLAENYWTCDWRQVRTGSGITNLNILPHFESEEYGKQDPRGPIDWAVAKAELQQTIGQNKTVTPLHEGQFVVVEA